MGRYRLPALVPCGFDNYVFSLKGVCLPVNGRIELFKPRMTEDKAITAKVRNVESHFDPFVSLNYEKVAKVSDSTGLIYGPVYVMDDSGGRKGSSSKMKGVDGPLIDEVVGSATVKERFYLGLLMPHIQVNVDCH